MNEDQRMHVTLMDDVCRHCSDFKENVLPALHREKFEVSPRMTPIFLPKVNFFGFGSTEFLDLYENFSSSKVEALRRKYYQSTYRSVRNRKPGAFFTTSNIIYQKDPTKHKFFIGPASDGLSHYKALLRAFFRFGVPIEEGLHYDVHKRNGYFSGEKFWDEKANKWVAVSGAYINITPDDHLRGD
jgi:hypothetical protein